ncbi:ABC transporter permease, partial [Streptomyces sp. SID10244]|nr:ABC transporter permease [Streptomyces sp. SID10244]
SVATKKAPAGQMPMWRLLLRDKFATVAAVILAFVLLVAIFGPWLVGDAATDQNLDESNLAPFNLDTGWMNILGTDPLGRSMLARLIV